MDVLKAAKDSRPPEHPAFTTLLTRLQETSGEKLSEEWLDLSENNKNPLKPRELMAACALSAAKVSSWTLCGRVMACALSAVEKEDEKRHFSQAALASKDADEADALRLSCLALFRSAVSNLPPNPPESEGEGMVESARRLLGCLRIVGWGNDHEEIRETGTKLANLAYDPYTLPKSNLDSFARESILSILGELERVLPRSATRFDLIRKVGKARTAAAKQADPFDTDSASEWDKTQDSTESLPNKGAKGEGDDEDDVSLELQQTTSSCFAWALATRGGENGVSYSGEVFDEKTLSAYGKLVWLSPHVKSLLMKLDELPVSFSRGSQLFAAMTSEPLVVPPNVLKNTSSDLLEETAEVCFYALRGASQNCSVSERDVLSKFVDEARPVGFRAELCVQFLTWVENDSPRAYIVDRLRKLASIDETREICVNTSILEIDRAVRGDVPALECCLAGLSTLKVAALSLGKEKLVKTAWRNKAIDSVGAALRQAKEVEEGLDPEDVLCMRPSMDTILDKDASSGPPPRGSASVGNIAMGRSRLVANAAQEVLSCLKDV